MPHIATGDDRAELGESSLHAFARVKVRSSSDKHDLVDVPARLEQSQRILENRPTTHFQEDLVFLPPHAGALAGGHDDRGRAHLVGTMRTRTAAASHNESMSVIPCSRAATRASASASPSRVRIHGPRASTSVSRGTVRRTRPSTTSLHVSVIGTVATLMGNAPTLPSPEGGGTYCSRGEGITSWITKRFAPGGAAASACRSRSTIAG